MGRVDKKRGAGQKTIFKWEILVAQGKFFKFLGFCLFFTELTGKKKKVTF